MMVDFPDHTAQETAIRSHGDAELLYKRGEKILRFRRSRWGSERERWRYKLLGPYGRGRVLHVGLGLGVSAEELLASRDVTELIAYEIETDIAQVYLDDHASEPRLAIETQDAHRSKPEGSFDLVLYELSLDSQRLYDEGKAYVTWAWPRVNRGGYLILPYDRFSESLVAEFPAMKPTIVSTQWRAEGVKLSLRALPIWIVVAK